MTDLKFLYQIYLEHPEVTTDSRRCPGGSLFFALKGESFDGNQFAAKALEAGAAIAVVDDETVIPEGDLLTAEHADGHYLLVPDVLSTLQELAAYHRQQFRGPVLQVTGTNGKTTTKELIAAVLSRKYNVLYTQGNLNNHIGVPLTLLRLRTDEHQVAIIETGANHPDEIRQLTDIVRPDYGLITNVGRAHLEGFGSFEGVKRTKGELYDYLLSHEGCHVFVSEASADLIGMLSERGATLDDTRCISYARIESSAKSCRCVGAVASADPFVNVWWRRNDQKQASTQDVTTHLIGAYNLDNVLAAICVGLEFGVPEDDISAALTEYEPTLGRSEYRKTERNELIIDAYNANLTSMLAALQNLQQIEHPRKMVILGDMKELGAESRNAHCQVVRAILGAGVNTIWLVGPEFRSAVQDLQATDNEVAIALGTKITLFDDVEDVKQAIVANQPELHLILVKGSNSTRLHQLPPLL